MPRYIALCTERNEEPPGVVFRTVDAPTARKAGFKVNKYHETLDGDFVVAGVYTPTAILQLGLNALAEKHPDIK